MREKLATDRQVAHTAGRQHGVVTIQQLAASGIGRTGVMRRVQLGRLHRVHRGVYAVGHPGLSTEGRWMAAVLACGARAVLSHRAAAALWGVLKAPSGPVDVTVPGAGGRAARSGIRIHRSPSLTSADVTRREGIPVTTLTRSFVDLRRVLPPDRLREAIRQAEILGLPFVPQDGAEPDHTRSELERRFLALCRRHRIPRPQVNVHVGPFLVDFLWAGERLVAEVDGYRYHGTRSAFEGDRARDAWLQVTATRYCASRSGRYPASREWSFRGFAGFWTDEAGWGGILAVLTGRSRVEACCASGWVDEEGAW